MAARPRLPLRLDLARLVASGSQDGAGTVRGRRAATWPQHPVCPAVVEVFAVRRVALFVVLALVATPVAVGGFLGRPPAAHAAGVDCVVSGRTITCRIEQPVVTAPFAD